MQELRRVRSGVLGEKVGTTSCFFYSEVQSVESGSAARAGSVIKLWERTKDSSRGVTGALGGAPPRLGAANRPAVFAGQHGDDARCSRCSVAVRPQQGRDVPEEGHLPSGEATGVVSPARDEGQRRESDGSALVSV